MTGSDCKAIRERDHIDQILLAAKSGVPNWKIGRYEKGREDILDNDEKERLFGALGVIPHLPYSELVKIQKDAADVEPEPLAAATA